LCITPGRRLPLPIAGFFEFGFGAHLLGEKIDEGRGWKSGPKKCGLPQIRTLAL
jgi:hypothetical protein